MHTEVLFLAFNTDVLFLYQEVDINPSSILMQVVKSNQRVNTPDINITKNTFSMEDSGRGASYTVPCDDYVHVVEFSPFDSGSAALLAYGGNQYVVVGTCRFQVSGSMPDSSSSYPLF
jgi:hypothetical protein